MSLFGWIRTLRFVVRTIVVLAALLWPVLGSAQILPAVVCVTLQAERVRYGPSPSQSDLAAILNATAWTHRTDGWGLSSKPAGNNCPQPTTGQLVACDTLQRGLLIWDVLSSTSPGPANPQCGDAGDAPADRPFVAPVDPGGGPTPPPPPPPPACDLTAIEAQLAKLGVRIETAVLDEATRDAALRVQVEAIAKSLEEHRAEARKALAWAKNWKNWIVVIGSVLSGWLIGK